MTSPRHVSIFSYGQPRLANIGDAIQTIALERLLRRRGRKVEFRDRDCPYIGASPHDVHVANGYLLEGGHDAPDSPWRGLQWTPGPARRSYFAGVHVPTVEVLDRAQSAWAESRSRVPVGARDPWTHGMVTGRRMPSVMVGCATLTLPRHEGPRDGGVVVVDQPSAMGEPGSTAYTHHVVNVSWSRQLQLAEKMLDVYQRAELVHTSRLHVLLPCLAFGTPVVLHGRPPFENPDFDRRFSLVHDVLRVPAGVPHQVDVGFLARRYEAHLDEILSNADADRGG
jgi:hypothetical protein